MVETLPEKQWEICSPDPAAVKSLQRELGMQDDLFPRLFVNRGITTYAAARDFLNPSIDQLHDPFLMLGMERAVKRLAEALHRGEKIRIYGDYDVDGTTAVALVYGFLKTHHEAIDYYLPNRYTEGYGISNAGVDDAHRSGCTLMIALDCGVKAIEQVKRANSYGIDVIICDHHLPGRELPEAYALLDPKQPDCTYPFKELSGCGLGFKLLQALVQLKQWKEASLYRWIDLVAISTACDIVPMVGENRILTHVGLEKIRTQPLPGVAALLEGALRQPRDTITVNDLVFRAGPRINAAGRMQDARQAVELLLEVDKKALNSKAQRLHLHNSDRQDLDKSITEAARQQVLDDPNFDQKKGIVVYSEDWHKGVIGIVASRLVEQFHKPTIVLTKSEGMLAGSARSVRGFSIHKALQSCAPLLDQFGGHKYAAGMKLETGQLEAFTIQFEKVVAGTISPESLYPVIEIEAELPLDRIPRGKKGVTSKLWQNVQRFAPFGPGNRRPVFAAYHVRDIGYAKEVGQGHLRCQFTVGSGQTVPAIGWNMAPLLEHVKQGPVDICFVLEENEFRGNQNLQLHLKDIKPSRL